MVMLKINNSFILKQNLDTGFEVTQYSNSYLPYRKHSRSGRRGLSETVGLVKHATRFCHLKDCMGRYVGFHVLKTVYGSDDPGDRTLGEYCPSYIVLGRIQTT
jgi:hypothetical protein